MSKKHKKKNCNEVWHFAYGSNLYIPQMLARVGEWTTSKKAQLRGWRLILNVKSTRWGGGTANIRRTDKPNDVVYGAIYLISRRKLEVLTEYEGIRPQSVRVESEGKEVEAKTYIFNQNKSPLKPVPLYIETIIRGLRQHCYGKDIIEAVKKELVS